MRRTLTLLGLLVIPVTFRGSASEPAPISQPVAKANARTERLERQFRDTVLPFLQEHCSKCHGKDKPKGDVDLSVYPTVGSVAKNHRQWAAILEQLKDGTMPPEKSKQPTAELRKQIIDWITAFRNHEAERSAGDPGSMLPRRLNNAEYDNTIRDLTGVDLRPTREFPVDPANEAGFDNSAESLTMSPALLKKYLEAGRFVADHLVMKPDGIAFSPHPVVTDTDRDKYCVNRIIAFYKKQRTDYADYFCAAWQYKHRAALGKPTATLSEIAAEWRISPKYLATIWTTLTEVADESGPIAAIQAMWKELPRPDAKNPEALPAECETMRDFVVALRTKLVPDVKNLSSPPVHNGSQCFVLWKNRQFVANRMKYRGGALELKDSGLPAGSPAAKAMTIPAEKAPAEKYEATFERFCRTFPDAFFISERARVYLDPKGEKNLGGRLLSAGFHSMTGYFRDDVPLRELMLDATEQRELDGLWREFDFVTGAPMRQYTSFIWFERTDSEYMRGPEFEFARSEDKDVTSVAKIAKLSEVYLGKAKAKGVSEVGLGAIKEYFVTISLQIRQVEEGRKAAEPSHVRALQDFTERAYRRPLTKAERDGVAAFYRRLRDADGLTHEEAVRDTLVGTLMSPHFCYRVDRVSDRKGANETVRPLSDIALASRLSYFLWSSAPDAELLKYATTGELHKPEVLTAQVRRMLRDPKARGLATEFGGNYLDFRRFEEHNAVDRTRFKTFDNDLRQAMFEEPIRFFSDVVREDRSVLDFLNAKRTFVNPVLARHYGMPEPKLGPDTWVQIDDADKYGRGGLLPMAVFLTRNSPGLRTSPVKRGYWVVRRLLGEHIPTPPSDVPELPADEAKLGERTLREVLAKHRENKSCAGCHNKFDAIGVAFEGFGPIGELRTKDLGGRPVETKATFPGGVDGNGLDGLKTYLRERRQAEFIDNLCRKMLAYALGRSLLLSDDVLIGEMRTKLAANGYRFGTLIETIVTSPQFLNKRVQP